MIHNGLEYLPQNNGCVLVKNVSNKSKRITIPHTINDLPVTAIGPHVFADNTMIMEVSIPKSVREIGNYAFAGCSNLEFIQEVNCVLPYKNRSLLIHKGAFQDCKVLKKLNLSSWISLVGEGVFQRCHNLVTIGNANNIYGNVPKNCFQACLTIPNLTVNSSTCLIGNYAFDWAISLKEITFYSQLVICDNEDVLDVFSAKKIRCSNTCNLVDLSYEGVDVEIIE